jgi:phosphatidate cytidylyltransferase
MVLVGTWVCDSVAYFVGREVGRTKLAPRISPGKSVEGALGGIAATVGTAILAAPTIDLMAPTLALAPPRLSMLHLGGLGLVIGVCVVLGDLVESFIKRQLGAKDSGVILPGHGGVLDRIDGLILAVAGAYFYLAATT